MLIIQYVDTGLHNVRVGDWHSLEKILALIFEARLHGLRCGVFLFGNGNQFREIHHGSVEGVPPGKSQTVGFRRNRR
jgi:hypothetical protein